MIKCRVKQKGLKFYPQYRKFIFWKACPQFEWTCEKWKDDLSESNRTLYISKKKCSYYSTLEDAELCLTDFVKQIHPVDTYKKHIIHVASKVKPEYMYSPQEYTFYYDYSYSKQISGCEVYPVCGETLKEVMEMIDILDNKKKLLKVRKIYTYDK